MRMMFYLATVLSEDVETQKNGIVVLFFNLGPHKVPGDINGGWKISAMVTVFPLRIVSAHLCHENSPLLVPGISLIRYAVGSTVRLRLRAHPTANPVECHYQLMTFGIPTEVLPMNVHGEFPLKNHREWLEQRRSLEVRLAQMEDVMEDDMIPRSIIPGPNDVVYGRDSFAQQHLGNSHFIFLIESWREDHDTAEATNQWNHSSHEKFKAEVVDEVIEAIKERGGRFLRKGDSGWEEVDEKSARSKVANAFRSRRKVETRRAAKIQEKSKAAGNDISVSSEDPMTDKGQFKRRRYLDSD
jgi:hypothetical protein